MIGHSGAPLEHLVHPAVCKTVRMIAKQLHVLEPTFFANGAEVGGVRERALGSPTHPLAHRGAWRRKTGSGKQEGSSLFPGVLVGPPHVRKCHQMSSKEHIQLGWVVRWVLSTPPGHPAARRCVRVVPVLPLLLCTRPARARPSVGGQSPTPAPRQLPWSPPRGPERTVRFIGFLSSRQPLCS